MPEAVIVATGRTPIGRAVKGSLVECRPDDLSALVIKTVLEKVPAAHVRATSRTCCSAAVSRRARRATTSPGWRRSWPVSTTSRASPSTATAPRRCRRSAWLRTPSGPARVTCSSRPGWRRSAATCTAPRTSGPAQHGVRRRRGSAPQARTPAVDRSLGAPGRQLARTSTSRWARRPRTWPSSRT